MSRSKILKNIKKNIKHKVAKVTPNYTTTVYESPLNTFIESLKRAGGEITGTLEGYDVVLEAKFAIAENGACFINSYNNKKDFSYYESIAIKLDKNKIYNTLEEAMQDVDIDRFAIFLSGPSKTADIEQSLVIGAHGAKRLAVMFSDSDK